MDDLITWLRAQLDDDERVARVAPAGPWHTSGADTIAEWTIYDAEWSVASATAYDHDEPLGNNRGPGYIDPNATAAHIARWDPARVLAEIDAKRKIIDECAYEAARSAPRSNLNDMAWTVLRALTPPYADQPGYRDEWRP